MFTFIDGFGAISRFSVWLLLFDVSFAVSVYSPYWFTVVCGIVNVISLGLPLLTVVVLLFICVIVLSGFSSHSCTLVSVVESDSILVVVTVPVSRMFESGKVFVMSSCVIAAVPDVISVVARRVSIASFLIIFTGYCACFFLFDVYCTVYWF